METRYENYASSIHRLGCCRGGGHVRSPPRARRTPFRSAQREGQRRPGGRGRAGTDEHAGAVPGARRAGDRRGRSGRAAGISTPSTTGATPDASRSRPRSKSTTRAKTPNFRCAEYEDFRVMLEKEKAVDAVLCATPDHLHAYVSVLAMRAGKHVYCEKPLTHNIWEARKVAQVAKETGAGHAVGQSRALARDDPADLRVDLGRRDRPGPRGPDLGASRALEQVAHGQAHGRGRHARGPQLGPLARAARAPAVSSGLRPGHLARLLGLRHGDDGRFRLPRPGQLVLGPRSGRAA